VPPRGLWGERCCRVALRSAPAPTDAAEAAAAAGPGPSSLRVSGLAARANDPNVQTWSYRAGIADWTPREARTTPFRHALPAEARLRRGGGGYESGPGAGSGPNRPHPDLALRLRVEPHRLWVSVDAARWVAPSVSAGGEGEAAARRWMEFGRRAGGAGRAGRGQGRGRGRGRDRAPRRLRRALAAALANAGLDRALRGRLVAATLEREGEAHRRWLGDVLAWTLWRPPSEEALSGRLPPGDVGDDRGGHVGDARGDRPSLPDR